MDRIASPKKSTTFHFSHALSTWLIQQLQIYGVNIVALNITVIVIILSLTITSISLILFQGYIDALGLIIAVIVPILILPLPTKLFLTMFLKLQQTKMQLQKKNIALKNSLREVKTLSGLLPICCSCKKIRNDKGYWSEVEQYISDHSDLQLTHGYCPGCIDALFPAKDGKQQMAD